MSILTALSEHCFERDNLFFIESEQIGEQTRAFDELSNIFYLEQLDDPGQELVQWKIKTQKLKEKGEAENDQKSPNLLETIVTYLVMEHYIIHINENQMKFFFCCFDACLRVNIYYRGDCRIMCI